MAKCPHCNAEHPDGLLVCPNTQALISQVQRNTDPMIGQKLEEKYLIQDKLGEGGMGAVYVGEHLMMKRRVAIKTLLPQFVKNQNAVQRFQREAQAASNIGHPNIITIHDLGQTPEQMLYIVMELLEGQDLGQLIRALKKQGGRLVDAHRSVEIMRQVAEGLAAAHEKGVVHRDLKPDNIFLTQKRDGSDRVKLLDFGISKIRTPTGDQAKLTQDGSLLGTPFYMSPEQAEGKPNIDHRADIYAFGVILYQLLVGRVPFEDENMLRVIVMHAREEPVPPRQANPNIPIEAEAFIMRMLAKDPAIRTQTMNDVIAQFDAVAAAYGMTFAGINTTGPLPIASSSDASSSWPKTSISGPLPVIPREDGSGSWDGMGTGPRSVNSRVGDTTGPNQQVGSWGGMDSGNLSGPAVTATPMAWSEGQQAPTSGGSGLKIGLAVGGVLALLLILGAVGLAIGLSGDGDDRRPRVVTPTPQPYTNPTPVVPTNQPNYNPYNPQPVNPVVPTNPYGNVPTHNPQPMVPQPVVPTTPIMPNVGTVTPPVVTPQNNPVTLGFVSRPSKVHVFRGDHELGVTPFNMQLDRNATEITLTCRLEGYQEREVTVIPSQDQTINIELRRIRRRPPASKTRPPRDRPNNNRPRNNNPLFKNVPNF